MYTKARRHTEHDTTSTHTNAILHRATTTRLEYTKAVAQELTLREVYHDITPIPDTLPVSPDTLTTLADKLTLRACYNCARCMDAYSTIECGTSFTTQEVQHLVFLRTIRGLSFG